MRVHRRSIRLLAMLAMLGSVGVAAQAENLRLTLVGKVCMGDGSGFTLDSSPESKCAEPVPGARLLFLHGEDIASVALSSDEGDFELGPVTLQAKDDCIRVFDRGRGGFSLCGASAARALGLGEGRVLAVIARSPESFVAGPRPHDAELTNDNPWSLGGETLRAFLQERVEHCAGTTLTGKRIGVHDFRGKVLLLDFWATACGPCVADIPYLKDAYQELHDNGLEIIGISQDRIPASRLSAWLQEAGVSWPQILDDLDSPDSLVKRFRVEGIPSSILIDRNGRVVATDLRGKQIVAILRQHVLTGTSKTGS